MAFTSLKHIIRPQVLRRFYSIHEPNYLKLLIPEIPVYPTLNLQIKGYDYQVVQKFQGFIQKFVNHLDIDVEDCWAMPPKELHIKRYKPNSQLLDAEFKLNICERNIQISNASATTLSTLLRTLESCLPPGVSLTVENFDPEYELRRYVPDTDLLSLKSELDELKTKK